MEDVDWLLKKEEYEPKKDKDGFIDKTIIHFVSLLSRIKKENVKSRGVLYKINPILKLISTIVLIALLSISRNHEFIYLVGAYFLVSLATINGNVIKKIILVSLTVPIFTIIILIPSMLMGNVQNSLIIVLKIVITLIAINILSHTTSWHDITKAFKILYISDIFILVFDITIRYIYLLGEFSLSMLYALKLRSVGRNKSKMKSVTSIMGNLFFKTKNMGEDMYSAMQCRGFTGEYISHKKFKFGIGDLIYLCISIEIVVLFFVF